MTQSATSFFRQAATAGPDFEHEETDTGGTKWPTKVVLRALHPETGEQMGFLNYNVPRRKADKITVQRLETHPDHQRKGVGSALMDEMQRRHPGTPIDHGDRTPAGKAWWNGYSDGKKVTRGRTMASAAEKPCPCCSGTGEHDTGAECYHCDGGRTVPADSPDVAACDGGRTAAADTPVPDNAEPYEHEHDWLPRQHFFAPGKTGLDPRLFDGDKIRPDVRRYLLGLLNSFWAPRYGDSWQSWARVYLAGGAASHFWGDNNDLDVLIGVDFNTLGQHCDTFTGEPWDTVSDRLTEELKAHLNDEQRMLPGPDGESGPWESTFFVLKPGPGGDQADIRRLHPYAAYDLTRDEWAVEPVDNGTDFGPEKLPEADWDIVDAIRKLVTAISGLPDGLREREGAALYDYLHTDRSAAFGEQGQGLYDPANVTWKALVTAPGEPLQQLIDWKHAPASVPAATQENAA
ncbi:GNAT family N-acetyltransferase [Streptomyces sp. cg35]|uniref:GNAT family N-acetyltransferase n=1 Tax=Streptomyces sp. cg35 TaxID=3421650 RepID=UPI003D1746D7